MPLLITLLYHHVELMNCVNTQYAAGGCPSTKQMVFSVTHVYRIMPSFSSVGAIKYLASVINLLIAISTKFERKAPVPKLFTHYYSVLVKENLTVV